MSEWRCGPECPLWRLSYTGRYSCFTYGDSVREGQSCKDTLSVFHDSLRASKYLLKEADERVGLYEAAIAARKDKEAKADA